MKNGATADKHPLLRIETAWQGRKDPDRQGQVDHGRRKRIEPNQLGPALYSFGEKIPARVADRCRQNQNERHISHGLAVAFRPNPLAVTVAIPMRPTDGKQVFDLSQLLGREGQTPTFDQFREMRH